MRKEIDVFSIDELSCAEIAIDTAQLLTVRPRHLVGSIVSADEGERRRRPTRIRRSGVTQAVAMQITGHRTISVYQRYRITNEDDRRKALCEDAGVGEKRAARQRGAELGSTRGPLQGDPLTSRTLQGGAESRRLQVID